MVAEEVFVCLLHATDPPKNGFDVVDWKNKRIVVFPPTEGTVWSWMWNFLIAPFGGIHLGFSLFYISLTGRIVRVLELREKRTGERKPVIFTGFSRGGALAEICAVDPLFEPWYPKCVSFAAPKWGFKQHKDATITRIQVGGDIVTRLPPWPYRDCVNPTRLRWSFLPSFSEHRYKAYREAVLAEIEKEIKDAR